MAVKIAQDAIFIGANKQAHVLAESAGLVAFGAATTVALWAPLAADHLGVYQTLSFHAKEVTCVRFLPGTPYLVSAAEDGQLAVWERAETPGNGAPNFRFTSSVQTPDSIATLAVADSVVVSGSTGGDISVWLLDGGRLVENHTFRVKPNFYPTTLCLHKVASTYLLVVGGTASNLHIYSFDAHAVNFAHRATLVGHEDWIKCLSMVTVTEGLDYILASGSQDRYIRLWRLRLNEAIDDSDEDESRLVLLSNKQYKFSLGDSRAAFSFEALLMGHDDWVTGLNWHPSTTSGNTRKFQLLSLSADTALMIWEMDEDSGIWVTASRLGELSIKGASTATGSSGGFWSCAWFFLAGAHYILASGKTGAIRAYKSTDEHNQHWDSVLGVTGAVREITDVVWSRDGSYLFATSLDQTTRLYAPWKQQHSLSWHEFARPQIHGYDMICADNLTATKFVSGGDEKILRVFEMTKSISALLRNFCGISNTEALPEAASLPVLGLSNKAANEQLEAGEAQQREEDFENGEEGQNSMVDVLESLTTPPLEDHLQRHTLFSEVEKLYGHGYEITCCASSPNGNLIASACRSNSAKHAVVRIFNAQNDLQLVETVLKGHTLTITSMEFSPDGRYLAAVSRDRQFSLWRVADEKTGEFSLVELNTKAHARIIWDCLWAPECSVFVTGSRDKSIKVWLVGETVEMSTSLKTSEPITSVACFKGRLIDGNVILAVGHESGLVEVYKFQVAGAIELLCSFPKEESPASRVNKLAFSSQTDKLVLAVGAADSSVRLYSLALEG